MIAVGISSALIGNNTIYTSQVPTRADSLAHRLQFSFPLLTTQAMTTLNISFSPEQTLADAEKVFIDCVASGAPVIDKNGLLQGVLTQADIQRVPPTERQSRLVSEVINCHS